MRSWRSSTCWTQRIFLAQDCFGAQPGKWRPLGPQQWTSPDDPSRCTLSAKGRNRYCDGRCGSALDSATGESIDTGEGRVIHHGDRRSSPTVAHDCDALDRSEIASRHFVWAHQDAVPEETPVHGCVLRRLLRASQPWGFAGFQHRSQRVGLPILVFALNIGVLTAVRPAPAACGEAS